MLLKLSITFIWKYINVISFGDGQEVNKITHFSHITVILQFEPKELEYGIIIAQL